MTREEAIERLQELQRGNNTEDDHYKADEVLCELLESLEHKDVVAAYRKIHRWFA